MIDLTALRSIALAATLGPWPVAVWIETDGNEWRATGPGHEDNAHDHGAEPGSPDEQAAQADARYLNAFSPSAALALLDELEQLRAELAEALDIAEQLTGAMASHEVPIDVAKALDRLRAVGRSEGTP